MKNRAILLVWLLLAAAASRLLGDETAGVGIALGPKDGAFVVAKILPDSPAARNPDIHVGDRLLAVGQGNQPAVEVKDLTLSEVVALIRGVKGTQVRLTMVSAGKDESKAIVFSFTRGELQQLARWGDGVRLAAGVSAPNIQMIRLPDKKPEQLANYSGKIVVLEFWATWCGPCQKLMAELQEYPGKYPDWRDKVVLIAASVDDEPDSAAERLEAKGWNETCNVWVESDAMKAFHVNGLPTIYVIDQQGKVAVGDVEEDIPTLVNRLLKGP